jgi:MFS family permease
MTSRAAPASERSIVHTYLGITALTTLAQSLIWGVNTLFLMRAGLNIFQVMVANAAFTVAQVIFEVPTGVVADTWGRRASYLLSVSIIMLSTLLYMWAGAARAGVLAFSLASVVLGLGFTFYTGAVDAWMVDALHSVNSTMRTENVFARSAIIFGIFMVIGTTAGGVLGQAALWLPYLGRTLLLVPALVLGLTSMPDLGFERRALQWSTVGAEVRKVAATGVRYGTHNPVVRSLMLAGCVQGIFGMFGFYSWQRYFLDLLGRDLIWVSGLVAAAIGLAGAFGGALVRPVMAHKPRRSSVLLLAVAASTVCIVLAGIVRVFWVAVPLYVLASVLGGVAGPVRSAWLNACIPSEQRATLISLDSLFGEAGGTVGQLGLGYVSKSVSIPVAWVIGGALQIGGLPFLGMARHKGPVSDAGGTCEVPAAT